MGECYSKHGTQKEFRTLHANTKDKIREQNESFMSSPEWDAPRPELESYAHLQTESRIARLEEPLYLSTLRPPAPIAKRAVLRYPSHPNIGCYRYKGSFPGGKYSLAKAPAGVKLRNGEDLPIQEEDSKKERAPSSGPVSGSRSSTRHTTYMTTHRRPFSGIHGGGYSGMSFGGGFHCSHGGGGGCGGGGGGGGC